MELLEGLKIIDAQSTHYIACHLAEAQTVMTFVRGRCEG